MPGLVPGIHVFFCVKTWMAGSSPAMTGLRLDQEALAVWMPHSVLARPRQRPARASSSGEVRLVQGMQPIDR